MDQLPRLGKKELMCLLSFTCNYVVFVWRGFLFLWVLGMGCVILFWHSLSLPYTFLMASLSTVSSNQTISDTEPPKFQNCPSIKKGYADRSRTNGSVHWDDPGVSDNSGSISLRQTSGPRSDEELEVGQYTVTYIAYDGVNNTAECTFEVVMKRKKTFCLNQQQKKKKT